MRDSLLGTMLVTPYLRISVTISVRHCSDWQKIRRLMTFTVQIPAAIVDGSCDEISAEIRCQAGKFAVLSRVDNRLRANLADSGDCQSNSMNEFLGDR